MAKEKMGIYLIFGLLFSMAFVSLGIFFILGTFKEWSFFVDPPADLWACYSLSLIKKLLGNTGLLIFNYVFGFLCVVLGMSPLFQFLKRIL